MNPKKCLNPKCKKEFTPKNAKGVYCSANCRASHAYQIKTGKDVKNQSFTYFPDLKNGASYSFIDGKLIPIEETIVTTAHNEEREAVTENPNQQRIAELEKELEAIPDKTRGLGKTLAASIRKKIFDLTTK